MRFAFADGFGCSLSFVARVMDEGHDAIYFIDQDKPPTDNLVHIGEGLVPREHNYERFVEWCKAEPDTIAVFCSSGLGKKADELRASGIPVLGGSTFMDKLEGDRLFGIEIAERIGAEIPPFEQFDSLSECASWAKSLGETECFFKSDKYLDKDSSTHACSDGDDLLKHLKKLREKAPNRTKCIVQQKIDGVPFSTAQWWNGMSFIGPYEHTIEHQAFMNGDVGPGTGCSLNAIWFTPESVVADRLGWKNLAEVFREHAMPPGLIDINAVVDKNGTPYFLEYTPRFGFDSEPTGFGLFDSLSDLFIAAVLGNTSTGVSDKIAVSIRLSLSPYPFEHSNYTDKHTCVGQTINGADGLHDGNFIAYEVMDSDGDLEMASPEGVVGLSCAYGDDLADLNEEVVEYAKSMNGSTKLQYRTDADKAIGKDAKALSEAGVNVHPGLVQSKGERRAVS